MTDLGNLAGKLSAYEGLGVWPSPDFRFAPGNAFHAGELAAVALVVVVVGTVVALRRREAALVGAAAAVLAIYWVSDRTQSPYVAAKALVLAAPLVMALALAAWPSERRGWMDGTLARMALVGVFALGAAYSSSLALRAAPVASQEQERELDALRPLVGNERTLFLGSDDHIAWLLRGVNVGSPQISAQRTPIAVPLRAEKPPITNQPFDFDSIGERTLDSFAYVIAPRSGYDSEPPPNFTRVRSGRLYELWRRTGATPPRETIEPGDAPGALLDCRRSAGRAISRDGGSATVWAAVPQIAKGGLPIAPGAAADLSIPLTRGRWVLSLQYTSSAPVRAVSRRGSWSLPANTARPGPYFVLGEVDVAVNGPLGVRLIAEQTAKLGSRGLGLRIGALAATRVDARPGAAAAALLRRLRRLVPPGRLGDLAQLARLHLVDEAAHGVLLRDERAGLDAGDGLANVPVEVGERLGGPLRLDPGLLLDRLLERVVGEREHAAVGVVDEDDLLGPEQALGDRQRADLVVGHDAAGVADDVGVALLQAERAVRVQARVHARDHGDLLGGRQRQLALVEARDVRLVVLEQLIRDRHGGSLSGGGILHSYQRRAAFRLIGRAGAARPGATCRRRRPSR